MQQHTGGVAGIDKNHDGFISLAASAVKTADRRTNSQPRFGGFHGHSGYRRSGQVIAGTNRAVFQRNLDRYPAG